MRLRVFQNERTPTKCATRAERRLAIAWDELTVAIVMLTFLLVVGTPVYSHLEVS